MIFFITLPFLSWLVLYPPGFCLNRVATASKILTATMMLLELERWWILRWYRVYMFASPMNLRCVPMFLEIHEKGPGRLMTPRSLINSKSRLALPHGCFGNMGSAGINAAFQQKGHCPCRSSAVPPRDDGLKNRAKISNYSFFWPSFNIIYYQESQK